ncbi:hypothetical protein MMC27_002033 [Xylographa pallens]|nr:hypothetical protein [Xylographa pallens]
MYLSGPLLLLSLTLSTSIAASSLPNNNVQARDEPAKPSEVSPPEASPIQTPEVAPPPEAAPIPPPVAAQNNGGDAAPADDNSDLGDDGGLDERDLRARAAVSEGENELYVRDE